MYLITSEEGSIIVLGYWKALMHYRACKRRGLIYVSMWDVEGYV